MGKFVIKNAKNGLKFDLKAANGQVIASSQVYKHKKTCLNGTASVMKNAPDAALEDQTVEGYVKMASCMNGIDSVRKNAVDAPVEEEEEE